VRAVRARSLRAGLLGALLALGTAAAAEPQKPGEPQEPRATREEWGALALLGEEIAPGEQRRLEFATSESFAGVSVYAPVIAIRGLEAGPTLCLTAGIHGDELNGVEVVRRVLAENHPETLRGTLIGVPIANPHGFRRSSRYLPDRRDLNRYFPGRVHGSTAARMAFALFDGVVRYCEALVDFHTGSFHRTNIAQIRADLRHPEVAELAAAFGAPVVIQNAGSVGTLRRAATTAGIPAITYEAGRPIHLTEPEIESGVRGVRRLLHQKGMSDAAVEPEDRQEIYHASRWVRANDGGILLAHVALGAAVEEGQILGTVTDPISNERSEVRSPVSGRVIGMALDQVVIPGFAAFHVAIPGTAAAMADDGGHREDGAPQPAEADLSESDGFAESASPLDADEQPE
jgi:predicted deacylase